jgi:hypothetical protein
MMYLSSTYDAPPSAWGHSVSSSLRSLWSIDFVLILMSGVRTTSSVRGLYGVRSLGEALDPFSPSSIDGPSMPRSARLLTSIHLNDQNISSYWASCANHRLLPGIPHEQAHWPVLLALLISALSAGLPTIVPTWQSRQRQYSCVCTSNSVSICTFVL